MLLLLALAASATLAQEPQYQEPAEEDKDLAPETTEYTFNPLRAEKEFSVGNFYWKKKNWRAAAGRYEEAVKWNPGYAEAYWKLALANERMLETESRETDREAKAEAARQALKKYLELAPDGKKAKKARRKLAALGAGASSARAAPPGPSR